MLTVREKNQGTGKRVGQCLKSRGTLTLCNAGFHWFLAFPTWDMQCALCVGSGHNQKDHFSSYAALRTRKKKFFPALILISHSEPWKEGRKLALPHPMTRHPVRGTQRCGGSKAGEAGGR